MGIEIDSTITRISFGYQVELLFEDKSLVTIGGLGSVRSGDGVVVEFDAEDPAPVAAQLMGLLHAPAQVEVAEGSILRLRSADGAIVEVPPMEAYEAWGLDTEDRTKIVCAPGGELVRFGPPAPPSEGTR